MILYMKQNIIEILYVFMNYFIYISFCPVLRRTGRSSAFLCNIDIYFTKLLIKKCTTLTHQNSDTHNFSYCFFFPSRNCLSPQQLQAAAAAAIITILSTSSDTHTVSLPLPDTNTLVATQSVVGCRIRRACRRFGLPTLASLPNQSWYLFHFFPLK